MGKNKSNIGLIILSLILMIAVFGLSGYIIYDKILNADKTTVTAIGTTQSTGIEITESTESTESRTNNEVNGDHNAFDKASEIEFISTELQVVIDELSWIGIVRSFPNQKGDGTMTLETNINLLDDEQSRQLFIMEYILRDKENYKKFIVLDGETDEVSDNSPTEEFTNAYLAYDDFNSVYKTFFGIDFDLSKALKSNKSFDENDDYVYYPNRRYGANGLHVDSIKASEVIYDESTNTYTASIELYNSERLSSTIGSNITNAELMYTKDNNGNIILMSFILR